MTARSAARLAWPLAAFAVAADVVMLAARVYGDPSGAVPELWVLLALLPAFAAYPVVGALVARREPRNPVGWLCLSFGVLNAVAVLTALYADHHYRHGGGHWPGDLAAAWVANWMGTPAVYIAGAFLPLLFPTGRVLAGRWRAAAWLAAASVTAVTLGAAFVRAPMQEESWQIDNPVGFLPPGIEHALSVPVALSFTLAAASVVVRFRRSRGEQRLQMKWFAYAAAITAASFIAGFTSLVVASDTVVQVAWVVAGVCFGLLPIATGVAILRYRLYEIDVIINRTLVYGVLTAAVLAAYGAVVAITGGLASRAGSAASLIAAALVAVAFAPLRDRTQAAVNRLLYGEREDPYAALGRLGSRLEAALEPAEVLPSIVEAVAQALRVPYAAIELPRGLGVIVEASHGRERGESLRVPLLHRGVEVGWLAVSPRAADAPLSAADRRLLEGLARQAGAAVHAVGLTAELQRSREELVAAREEERRRLRRDLHDGLGPQLAGMAMQLAAAHRLRDRPEQLEPLLVELQTEMRNAIVDIRRLVYGLRPPALDERGLVGAIRDQADRFRGELDVTVDGPGDLGSLPAAVEVAAYRIATEALTNVVKHARAQTCSVVLALDGALEIEVRDDGDGVNDGARAGVGLASMRERAAELGGTLSVERNGARGTRVCARLPVGSEA